jgi:hypothetical protein
MKPYIYTLLIIFIFGCTTTKVVHNPKKNDISGNWTLSKITQGNIDASELKELFDFPIDECLKGSTWSFGSDGTSGSIRVSGENCTGSSKKIHWLLYEPGDGTVNLQFKYVAPMEETNAAGKGFQTIIKSVNENEMVMQASNKEGTKSDTSLVFTKMVP